ncbi:unnamed protein product [Medioppia subpectinata]|uniref:B3/B4 tRNA-binding domain-containing protein n=1 Tax=Medioppia subpectinata TaxID=1979941 RepID=A0A7R9KZJ0_9ACAR|nr:unnamed protein product [Medioppia subpectinata]CAG2112793.1 unnamed protein product [Medioppia subpectinata]
MQCKTHFEHTTEDIPHVTPLKTYRKTYRKTYHKSYHKSYRKTYRKTYHKSYRKTYRETDVMSTEPIADYRKHVADLAKREPRELVLNGQQIGKQVAAEGGLLSDHVFAIKSLNFLEVIRCEPLIALSPAVSRLDALQSLVLHSNGLKTLPDSIGSLSKLKFMDVSRNQIQSLPDTIGQLSVLQSLNAEHNQLADVPDLSGLKSILVVKLSGNELTRFPASLCPADGSLQHLSEIHANSNQIGDIPHTISKLPALKHLDLSGNQLQQLPGQLGDCSKIKVIDLKNNKLKDRRLVKLIDQCHTKQIMDYIRAQCPRTVPKAAKPTEPETTTTTADADNDDEADGDSGGGRTGRDLSQDRRAKARDARRRRRSTSRSPRSSESDDRPTLDTIHVLPVQNDEWFKATTTPAVHELRKIVVCLVRGVDLSRDGTIKNFLALQTGLHAGICGQRQHATIATHDLAKVMGRQIHFDVRPPTKIRFQPLNRAKDMTAQELYKQLNEEAEAYRKEKKRQSYSGVHKYLFLLKGKQRFPCVMDDKQTVISLPPLINSETTKITEETKDILLEVTGESVPVCRKVMDALLHGMLKQNLSAVAPVDTDSNGGGAVEVVAVTAGVAALAIRPKSLSVEPVKVVDTEGKLYVQYPSKTDLQFADIDVKRPT